MTTPIDEIDTIQSTETAFDIIETIKNRQSAGVTELANELDYAKSTIHKYLATLVSRGYLLEEDGQYRVGLRFLDLGVQARNNRITFQEAHEKVEELAAQTDEKVWLLTEQHGRGIHLYGASIGSRLRTYARTGKLTYLHQTAAGKAILANLPDERINQIVSHHGLSEKTDRTITDRKELFDTIEQIRNRGYATNRGETVQGLRAIGAPICDQDETALAAISISGPENRLQGERFQKEIPDLLLGATNEIEINLKYR
jgi:DNA-binding IclR family transcriptional regulator